MKRHGLRKRGRLVIFVTGKTRTFSSARKSRDLRKIPVPPSGPPTPPPARAARAALDVKFFSEDREIASRGCSRQNHTFDANVIKATGAFASGGRASRSSPSPHLSSQRHWKRKGRSNRELIFFFFFFENPAKPSQIFET